MYFAPPGFLYRLRHGQMISALRRKCPIGERRAEWADNVKMNYEIVRETLGIEI